jgi:hypothetical protein
MSHPPVVYLDSQDYSRLANPPAGKVDFYNNLNERLETLVNARAIEIRYSMVHVSEISHTDPSAFRYARGRAASLTNLSQGRCLPVWNDIFTDEVRRNFQRGHIVETNRENNRWIDLGKSDVDDFVSILATSAKEALKESGTNRKTRRRAARMNLPKILMQSGQGQKTIAEIITNLNRAFPASEPFSERLVTQYVTGADSEGAFVPRFHEAIMNPYNLIAQISLQTTRFSRLPHLVRDIGNNLMAQANPIVLKLSKLWKTVPPELAGETRDRLVVSARGAMQKARNTTIREELAERAIKEDLNDDDIAHIDTPTADVLYTALAAYFVKMVKAAQHAKPLQRLKQSDAADLLHAQYIPYVDIFRCDTAWTDILSPIAKRYGTTVVDRIDDLVPAIDALTASRAGKNP